MILNKNLLTPFFFLCALGISANESGSLSAFKLKSNIDKQQSEYSFNNSRFILKGLPFTSSDTVLEDKILGSIEVKFVNFGESRISIQDSSKVDLSNSDLARTESEKEIMNQALSKIDPSITPSFNFIAPIKSTVTSGYGKQRFINGQRRNPHLALDLDGELGDPVVAPLKAKVILTGDFFYTGNTIFLEHGRGLYTSYAHLSEIKVKIGQSIQQGAVIGLIGATGRVTGPHLHWTVYFDDNAVNPTELIKDNYLSKLFSF
ncbi:MAG: M23 family metallopeptidase [Gammaproteobacteria bacterium]